MIRLGRISYVNMAPVFHRLDAEVEEVHGVPTDLNARLLDGEIDLAPISSIEYARHADRRGFRASACPQREPWTRSSSSRARSSTSTPWR